LRAITITIAPTMAADARKSVRRIVGI